jgi:hypothetical protein
MNLSWRMKLKTNKSFTKELTKKIKNKKNKNQVKEYNIC